MGAALSIIGRVPLWAWLLTAALAWGGWQRWRAIDARDDFVKAQQQAQVEQAAAQAAAATESARRAKIIQEAADAATLQAERDRAAAARARVAGDQLRSRVAVLEAQLGAGDPTASGGCQAAREAAGMLADVFRRADARAGELAAAADAYRTAGEACEAAYTGLTGR